MEFASAADLDLKVQDLAYRSFGVAMPTNLGAIMIYTLPDQENVTIKTLVDKTWRIDYSIDYSNLPEGAPIPEEGPGMIIDTRCHIRSVVNDDADIFLVTVESGNTAYVILFREAVDLGLFEAQLNMLLTV